MTHNPALRFTAAVFAMPVALGTLLVAPAQATAPAVATALSAHLAASGDVNGSGDARLTLNRRKVCATITWRGIEAPDSAHIHKKSDGSVVVDLTGAVTGGAKCTRGVPRRTVRQIINRPGRYYVNVHNATYPAGAIQGKLHR